MAFLFGDSCGHYATDLIGAKWAIGALAVNAAIVDDAAAISPYRVLQFSGAGNTLANGLTHAVPATTAFVAGCYFKTSTLAAAKAILGFDDGGTEHLSLRFTTAGTLTVTRNGTVLATSVSAIAANTWYHIEIKATIGDAGDAPSGQYQVKVNGADWIADSGAGQDTRNAGNQSFNVFRLGHQANSSSQYNNFQHVYLLNQTGAVASDFLGPCRFALVYPVAVGDANDWTGNYADNWVNVGEQIADGDVTFNQSATAGHKDKFTCTDVPSGTVHAVQHVLLARQDGGAARTIRALTRIGGTDYNGASLSTGATYAFLLDPVTLSPATTAQWDDAEINGAEFGYELVS